MVSFEKEVIIEIIEKLLLLGKNSNLTPEDRNQLQIVIAILELKILKSQATNPFNKNNKDKMGTKENNYLFGNSN